MTIRSPLLLLTLCAACAPRVETQTVLVVPDVPEQLRTPCLVADRHQGQAIETVGPAIDFIVDLARDRDCANGKIRRVDTILDRAEIDAALHNAGWK